MEMQQIKNKTQPWPPPKCSIKDMNSALFQKKKRNGREKEKQHKQKAQSH